MSRFLLLSLSLIAMAADYGYGMSFNTGAFADIDGLKAVEDELFKAINEERQANGLTTLKRDTGLTAAARQHSSEMESLLYFSHESPTSGLTTVRDRVYAAGLTDLVVAENLAVENSQKPGDVPAADIGKTLARLFMDSETHRANILDPRFTHTGVGCVVSDEGTLYCTQVFSLKVLDFKSIKVKEKNEDTLNLFLKLKFDDEVGIWIDDRDVYVFQPRDGIVEIRLAFLISQGPRLVVMARRVPGTFGPMTGFFMGRFDPRKPIKFSNAITDIDVAEENQELTREKYYIVEAKGIILKPGGELKLADGDNRFGIKTSKTEFEAVYGVRANTGKHMLLFVTGNESCHGLRIDTETPLENAFSQPELKQNH